MSAPSNLPIAHPVWHTEDKLPFGCRVVDVLKERAVQMTVMAIKNEHRTRTIDLVVKHF